MKKIITLLMLCYCFSMNAQITNANFITEINACLATNPVDGNCTGGNFGAMSTWDVSAVTDMTDAFKEKATFNADISGWDVSNVTIMKQMFLKAIDFDQDIGSWDVSSVTTMEKMFKGNMGSAGTGPASKFNQDISGWDVSNVTNFWGMFNETEFFNQDCRFQKLTQ